MLIYPVHQVSSFSSPMRKLPNRQNILRPNSGGSIIRKKPKRPSRQLNVKRRDERLRRKVERISLSHVRKGEQALDMKEFRESEVRFVHT